MQTSYILACINSVKPDMWNYNSPKQVFLEMEVYWKFAWSVIFDPFLALEYEYGEKTAWFYSEAQTEQ